MKFISFLYGMDGNIEKVLYRGSKDPILSSSIPLDLYKEYKVNEEGILKLSIKYIKESPSLINKQVSLGNLYPAYNSFIISNLIATIDLLILIVLNRMKEELSSLNKEKDKLTSSISDIEGKDSYLDNINTVSTVHMSNKSKKRFKKERTQINENLSIEKSVIKSELSKYTSLLYVTNKKIANKELEISTFESNSSDFSVLDLFNVYSNNKQNIIRKNMQYPTRSYSTTSIRRKVTSLSLLSSSNGINSGINRFYTTNHSNLASTSPSNVMNYFINSPIYIELSRLLNNSQLNNETQMQIEKFLNNQGLLFLKKKIDESLDINYYKINPLVLEELKKSISELDSLVYNYRSNLRNNTSVSKDAMEYLIISSIDNEEIISVLLGRLLRIISNTNLLNRHTNCTSLAYELGQNLVYLFYSNKYKEHLRLTPKNNDTRANNLGLRDFIDSCYSKEDSLFTDTFKIHLGLNILNLLEEVKLIYSEVITERDKKTHHFLANRDILEKIGKYINLSNSFIKIPMIVKPKEYGKDKDREILGGYFLNDQEVLDPLIIKNYELKEQSTIGYENIVYDTVNNLSSVAYRINNNVLNFVLERGLECELYTDPAYLHPLEIKQKKGNKLTFSEKQKLSAFLSRKQLEMNILSLALCFKNVSQFYIPVRIDNRGRVYCMADYLNYQSIELAKALLIFSKGEKVFKGDRESIDYLKIFGANCFGNGIDKKSYNDRVQ